MKRDYPTTDTAPDSYKIGILYVENLTEQDMLAWLEDELREKVHILSGQADDFPVQAILNYYYYLSFKVQRDLDGALDTLVLKWKQEPEKWPEPAIRALFSLVAEFSVTNAKYKLKSLAESEDFRRIDTALQLAVLGTIAELSVNDDRHFWNNIAGNYPAFAGMAFQVLTRIAPAEAIRLLERLPDNESTIGSVARKLPDFVSQQRPGLKQREVLDRIAAALNPLSAKSAADLKLSLTEAGFEV